MSISMSTTQWDHPSQHWPEEQLFYARKLAGSYRFVEAVPWPKEGAFPPEVIADMGITLDANLKLDVRSPGANSNCRGTFRLGRRGGTISFDSGAWTQMGLMGDDPLTKKRTQAEEFLQEKLSPDHFYQVGGINEGDGRTLRLTNLIDDSQLVFVLDDAPSQ
jgi:hypothetical protein